MVGTFRILPQAHCHLGVFAWGHGVRDAVASAHQMVPFWYSSIVIWRSWTDPGRIADIRLRLHGPQPKTYVYSSQSAVELIGIAVAPELAPLALNMSNHDISGQIIDWTDERFADALDLAGTSATPDVIAGAIARPVLQAVADNSIDNIDFAIRMLRRMRGTGSLSAIRQHVEIGERQFRARIKDRIGISAKGYSRLLRANALIAEADRQVSPLWADLAHRFGFFDQAHMINELRELTGLTPSRLASERRGEDRALDAAGK